MVDRSARPPRATRPARAASADAGEAKTPHSPSARPARASRKRGERASSGNQGGNDGADPEREEPAAEEPATEVDADTDADADGEVDEGLVADAAAVIELGTAGDDDEPVAEVVDGEVVEADSESDRGDDELGEPDDVLGGGGAGRGKRKRVKDEGRVGLIKRDPMQAYMQEVRRFPLLTPEEEHSLATRLVEHGDTTAARALVEANLRLVVKIAYEYRRAHRNLLDLVQEGNIGLIQAVGKFDPTRGVKLSSYAAFWIRAYILKFILNNWRLVKIGTTQAQRKLFFNLRKERERLEQLGFYPTAKLLAENLDVTEKEVVEMEKRLAAPEASLDAPVPGDEDGARTRLDFVPSEDTRPDQAVAQSEFSTIFNQKLDAFQDKLTGREKEIFVARWRTDPPKTLQELGDVYGVSRERARQLEKRVLDRLKKYLEVELGTAVDIDALSRD